MVYPNSSDDFSSKGKSEASREAAKYDSILVRKFLAGDQESFNEIVSRYKQKLFTYSFKLLKDAGDAEEVTQDVLIRAYRKLNMFRGESSLSTWLHTMTRNLSYNRYWYFHRRSKHLSISIDAPVGEESSVTLSGAIASEEGSPIHAVSNKEFSNILERSMKRLYKREREIINMRNVKHLSYEEIGDILCISVGTVKSRLARVRMHLRRLIAVDCPDIKTEEDIRLMIQPEKG